MLRRNKSPILSPGFRTFSADGSTYVAPIVDGCSAVGLTFLVPVAGCATVGRGRLSLLDMVLGDALNEELVNVREAHRGARSLHPGCCRLLLRTIPD